MAVWNKHDGDDSYQVAIGDDGKSIQLSWVNRHHMGSNLIFIDDNFTHTIPLSSSYSIKAFVRYCFHYPHKTTQRQWEKQFQENKTRLFSAEEPLFNELCKAIFKTKEKRMQKRVYDVERRLELLTQEEIERVVNEAIVKFVLKS